MDVRGVCVMVVSMGLLLYGMTQVPPDLLLPGLQLCMHSAETGQ